MSSIFISYSHADEQIVKRLHQHMSVLKKEGKITTWHDKDIIAGDQLDNEINTSLKEAETFLAIVSPDYLSSTYCYEIEFKQALEWHNKGTIHLIPIIAEACDWKNSPLGKLKAIPMDGKPISNWNNPNIAYQNIIEELRKVLEVKAKKVNSTIISEPQIDFKRNYKIKKDFTAVDKLDFKEESFERIREYFKASLEEINSLESVQARFTESETNSFSAVISNRAKIDSTGYIHVALTKNDNLGSRSDLNYSFQERSDYNHLDKSFIIGQDDYQLFWKQNNFYNFSSITKETLTAKEIAEQLWIAFIDQVGLSY